MKKNKLYLIITAFAMSAMLLSGCGKNTTNDDGLFEISIMLDWTANTNHTGLYVAQNMGYFEDAGLKVNIIEASENGVEACVAAKVTDFGISYQDYLVPAFSAPQEQMLEVTAVAAIINHNTSGIISPKELKIDSPKKMPGNNYATWELPIEQSIIRQVVTADGGNFDDIELIPSTVEDVKAAFASGIDAVWIYYACDGISCEYSGVDTNFFYIKDYDEALDYYSPVIIANDDFLKEHPNEASAFIAAVSKGYNYSIDNPKEAAKILVDANDGLDLDFCIASQEWISKQYTADGKKWGEINPERWDNFYEWVYENNLCEYQIPSGYGFSNEYLPE